MDTSKVENKVEIESKDNEILKLIIKEKELIIEKEKKLDLVLKNIVEERIKLENEKKEILELLNKIDQIKESKVEIKESKVEIKIERQIENKEIKINTKIENKPKIKTKKKDEKKNIKKKDEDKTLKVKTKVKKLSYDLLSDSDEETEEICRGITKTGNPCRNKAVKNGSCRRHYNITFNINDDHTVKELKSYAKYRELSGYSNKNRDELIDMIKNSKVKN